MSKGIWHTVDKTPEEDRVIVVKSKRTGEYLVGSEFEFILDNFTKWAYFDDLLALETELDRTRKALDVLLLTINRLENQNYKDCAWNLRLAIAKIKAIGIADKALKQITTTLENKNGNC